ncbi:MAG: hypothetical protein M0R66_01740 [Candidatus Omnitrophica bacterium]|nr:hypothetical protein [Candidatus Omnitrophota bacterium]
MNLLFNLKEKFIIDYLRRSSPEALLKKGEKEIIPVFKAAGGESNYYKKMLKEANVDIEQVNNLAAFKKQVPLTSKKIFQEPLSDLCFKGKLNKLQVLSVSSGFSREFSYSLTSKEELKKMLFFCDFFLDHNFHTQEKKTLFINCLGMGVKVHTSLALAETSVRPDSVLAVLKKSLPHFEQFIIVGNAYFLKKVAEDIAESNINLSSKALHLLMGEDWFPENYRSYLSGLLGHDFNFPHKGIIGASFGISELGLSLFQETKETIQVRRLAFENKAFREALFGAGIKVCPVFFQYNPLEIFLEEIEESLVFTILRKDALIPLLRYDSKDKGKIVPYRHLEKTLKNFHYEQYLPEFKLPLVAVFGRKDKVLDINGVDITPEEIKEALYSDFLVAALTTGYFRMSKENNAFKLEVQLKEGKELNGGIENKFIETVKKHIKMDFSLVLYPYDKFPYGMGLIYEQKFKYI